MQGHACWLKQLIWPIISLSTTAESRSCCMGVGDLDKKKNKRLPAVKLPEESQRSSKTNGYIQFEKEERRVNSTVACLLIQRPQYTPSVRPPVAKCKKGSLQGPLLLLALLTAWCRTPPHQADAPNARPVLCPLVRPVTWVATVPTPGNLHAFSNCGGACVCRLMSGSGESGIPRTRKVDRSVKETTPGSGTLAG